MNRHGGRGGPMRGNNPGNRGGRYYGQPSGGGGRQSGQGNVSRGMPVPRAAAVAPPSQRMQPYPTAKPIKPAPQSNNNNNPKPQGQKQSVAPFLDQCYETKVRGLVEHRIRTPHRRNCLGNLLKTIAHWTSFPALTTPVLNQYVKVEIKANPEECLVAGETTEPTEAPTVNVRALLCTGYQPLDTNTKTPSLKRVTTIYRKSADGLSSLYGGETTAKTHEEMVKYLTETIKEQSGLDLSPVVTWYKFCEHVFAGAVPTVVYLPALWELGEDIVMSGVVKEVTTERVELIEQELSPEGMTDEEYQEAKAALKPEEKTITEVSRVVQAVPVTATLADLLSGESKKGQNSKDVMEGLMAADSLDEFLKRDMAMKISRKLSEREKEAQEAAAAKAKEEQEREERKRKREEEEKEEREKKEAELETLKAKWEVEDQGKTDDEKRDALIERKKIIAELMGTETEGNKQENGNKRFKTHFDVDQTCIEAFEFFDRPNNNPIARPSGFLQRPRLENLLLCIDDTLCKNDIDSRLSTTTGFNVSYKMLCTTERKEALPDDEPVPEAAAEAVPEATPLEEDELPIAEEVIPEAEPVEEEEMA